MTLQTVPLLVLMPVLALIAWSDLRELRIPNKLTIAALVVFAATAVFVPFDEIPLRLLAAGICFAICFAIWCFGIMGGGDVKMLPVLCLFVPIDLWWVAPYIFSASMLIGVSITWGMQRARHAEDAEWESVRNSGKFPMGISIALTGLGVLVAQLVLI
ncbi:A24 family peptidase [Shimia biformata]|uniref:A24 family peptidase n=1 Tax=Shimia biformata TaxID=1294299 RepID=UPI00194F1003|nr:prepilin peptidase [Shimia biformata]